MIKAHEDRATMRAKRLWAKAKNWIVKSEARARKDKAKQNEEALEASSRHFWG